MVGGYTIIHLFLKIFHNQRARVKNLQFELHLSHHFTEDTHQDLSKLAWGQDITGFPEESKSFLPNWISKNLTISSVKQFNIKAVEFIRTLKNVDVYYYEKGSLSISSDAEEFLITAQEHKISRTYEKRYPKHLAYLLDCIVKPREHYTKDFQNFIATEMFLKDGVKTPYSYFWKRSCSPLGC